MKVIETVKELKTNLNTLDSYINNKIDPTYEFAISLIKKGVCFVVQDTSEGLRFYPSRFIGYKNNNMDKHLNNFEKDGKETNPALYNILGHRPKSNSVMDKAYREYCESLGFIASNKGAFGVERKYWEII